MKTLLTALALNSGIARADTLFTGSIINSGKADIITDYRNDNGAQATIEGIVSEEKSIETGLRTPFVKDFRLDGTLGLNDSWGYTTFVEKRFNESRLRAGVMQSPELFGGLVGGELNTEKITLDADIGLIDNVFEARGFVAIMPGEVYLNVGGNLFERSLMSTQGLIRKGFGFYNLVKIDVDGRSASGKLMIGDKFAMNRGNFDFRSQLKTGTELENVTTGTILASWPPFDAYCSDRFSFAGNWSVSEDAVSIIGELGYNIDRKFMVTTGVSYDGDYGTRLGLLSSIPNTPFEVWLNGEYNLKDNSITTTAYVGGNWEW